MSWNVRTFQGVLLLPRTENAQQYNSILPGYWFRGAMAGYFQIKRAGIASFNLDGGRQAGVALDEPGESIRRRIWSSQAPVDGSIAVFEEERMFCWCSHYNGESVRPLGDGVNIAGMW